MTSASSISTNISPRMGLVSGSNQFVTQQVYCHPSQTANHRISVSISPAPVR